MSIKNIRECAGCEHFVVSADGRGYCMVGRNNLIGKERKCPNYNKLYTDDGNESYFTEKSHIFMKSVNFLALASFAACAILTITALVFGLYFAVTVLGMSYLRAYQKMFLLLVALLTIALIVFILFSLGKHFIVARWLELIVLFFVVVLVLMNYETIWFSYHIFVVSVINLLI